ncbi:MAG: hypothetical protein KJZ93_24425 [Caldilineaceae bacterium]|nr:hypothetical protein [Caldilineaceae bacterium]
MTLYRRLRRRLQGAPSPSSHIFTFTAYRRAAEQAHHLVRFFYLFVLYQFTLTSIHLWRQASNAGAIEPLWPVFWVEFLPRPAAFAIAICIALAAGLAGLLATEQRLARVMVFVGYLLLNGLQNSFGKINHGDHAMIAVAFVLIWLPHQPASGNRNSVTHTHLYLSVFGAAQVMVGLFYTMSGLWKVYVGAQQLLVGEINTFHPYALATLVAFRLLQTGQEGILGWLIVANPLVGWPLHMGALYLELGALMAAFRPPLHRIWGVGLLLFHLATWLLMEIPFLPSMVLMGLFFVQSPLAPATFDWRAVLPLLPGLGIFVSGVARRAGA